MNNKTNESCTAFNKLPQDMRINLASKIYHVSALIDPKIFIDISDGIAHQFSLFDIGKDNTTTLLYQCEFTSESPIGEMILHLPKYIENYNKTHYTN